MVHAGDTTERERGSSAWVHLAASRSEGDVTAQAVEMQRLGSASPPKQPPKRPWEYGKQPSSRPSSQPSKQPPKLPSFPMALSAGGYLIGPKTYAFGSKLALRSLCRVPYQMLQAARWQDVSRLNWSEPPRLLFFCPDAHRSPSDMLLLRRSQSAAKDWSDAEWAAGRNVSYTPLVVNRVLQRQEVSWCAGKVEQYLRWRQLAEADGGCSITDLAIPQTYVLPQDCNRIRTALSSRRNSSWIAKPSNSSHGRGIQIMSRWNALDATLSLCRDPRSWIVQEYIKPLPIEGGYKFDLRAFLLVTARAGRPLRAYYHRGIARRADTKYVDPTATGSSMNAHVTNVKSQASKGAAADSHFLSFNRVGRALTREFGFAAAHMQHTVPAQMRKLLEFAVRALDVRTSCFEPGVSSAGLPLSAAMGSFQVFAADFAMDPRGNVWLLEVNSAPLWTPYPTDDSLTPAVYRTALELMLHDHGPQAGPPLRRYAGWELIGWPTTVDSRLVNRSAVQLPATSLPYSPCKQVARDGLHVS